MYWNEKWNKKEIDFSKIKVMKYGVSTYIENNFDFIWNKYLYQQNDTF